jgi:hypothetical protein
MNIPVHDNKLISYTVSDLAKTILFETVFEGKTTNEFTNISFSNVTAYFFEHHSLQLGTIFFDMKEIAVEIILNGDWEKFEEGRNWRWPGFWADTKQNAKAYFEENAVRAYEISSSCGLSGWVLAQEMRIFSKL